VPDNAYNVIPYPSFPRNKTHPDRLAAVGTLFGMTPAPVTNCRYLEIGCGDGGNLVPMAYWLPGSRFLGVDLADEPIAAGRRAIASLDLGNLTLEAADLRNIGPEAGEFDYIVAHGLYSWVPADVRDRLLAVCRERLAPQGIAYISYNAYPGRHVRQMLREMMLYHVRNLEDPVQRIEQGRWFLEFLRKSRLLSPAWGELVDQQVAALLKHAGGGLYHDDLAEVNDSVYFHEFAAHARRHGLQYLGEADFHEMFDPQGSLAWLKDDVLEREQYLDFLRIRLFRQTLLCREEVALNRELRPAAMRRFLFSAPAKTVEGGQIEGLHGVRISALHDAVKQVTAALGEVYPFPLSFEELVPYAGDPASLEEIVFALFTGGFADVHVYQFPCADAVTAKPRASRLARYQASVSRHAASACHGIVELEEINRFLVMLLDGTRTHREIAEALAKAPGGPTREQIREGLPKSLEWLAHEGLLEG